MKQKDKKLLKRNSGKLSNLATPEDDILDDLQGDAHYKAKRTPDKSGVTYKNDLDLRQGRVIEIKSNYANIVRIGEEDYICTLSGRLKQFRSGSKGLTAVGDWVEVDFSFAPHYRIETILNRRNALLRYSEGGFAKEIIIAANIDLVIITASLLLPNLKPGLIDRYICIARVNGITPVVCINKIDLTDDYDELNELAAFYRACGIRVICASSLDGRGMDELKEVLTGHDSVFSGQSGTGKTSLINYLEPDFQLLTGEISSFNEKGRHTTTQAVMKQWSFGGNLVDTPGIKTINLHSSSRDLIPSIFPGFDKLAPECQYRSCRHIKETGCAVIEEVENDKYPVERYDSYLRLMESL